MLKKTQTKLLSFGKKTNQDIACMFHTGNGVSVSVNVVACNARIPAEKF